MGGSQNNEIEMKSSPTDIKPTEELIEVLPQDDPNRYPGHVSMLLIYAWASLCVATFSFVIPVSVEFTTFLGQSQFMAGCVVAFQCFLSAIMSIPAYHFTQKYGLKVSFIVCTCFFIAGMFLYIAACPAQSFALLLIARCVTGIGGQKIAHWYTGRAVGIKRRTEVFQYVNAGIATGYSIGPLIAAAMYAASKNDVNLKDNGVDVESYDNIWWNRVTAPAWLLLILLVVLLLIVIFHMKEPLKETKELQSASDESKETPLQGILNLLFTEKVALGANLLATFCLPIVIASWEIVSVNEAVFTWGWPVEIAAVYVGLVFLFLIPATVILAKVMKKFKFEDRSGMVFFGCVTICGFFFLWDYFSVKHNAGIITCYTIGSFIVLIGFQLARGCCWSMLSKQVPTHSKGMVNTLLHLVYIVGRGSGALIADCFRTDIQSQTDYEEKGFTAWSPRNTYAWSMQILCIFVVGLWIVLYKINVPCKGSS